MKRRNADLGKVRRPMKRGKISDGIYASTFLYVKFLVVWALVLLADFLLEFRFEFLWPFWLLVHSVYDSFKYQGFAFSVIFVCIAIFSDVICYLVIPVQWLFFVASTYVWVQYVWHTGDYNRGICLPTVTLWLLFVLYIEGTVRLKDTKATPFNIDLGRPFAAHCIGYPVVTLGFGFKSYITYRLRLRKQKEVQKENDSYMQILRDALPPVFLVLEKEEPTLVGAIVSSATSCVTTVTSVVTAVAAAATTSTTTCSSSSGRGRSSYSAATTSTSIAATTTTASTTTSASPLVSAAKSDATTNKERSSSGGATSHGGNAATTGGGGGGNNDKKSRYGAANGNSSQMKKGKLQNGAAHNYVQNKDDRIFRLECEMKRLRSDLQITRNSEHELRAQLNCNTVEDKSRRNEVSQLRLDNSSLQNKYDSILCSRDVEKHTVCTLERQLSDERRHRNNVDAALILERQRSCDSEAAYTAMKSTRQECNVTCKRRICEYERESQSLKEQISSRIELLDIKESQIVKSQKIIKELEIQLQLSNRTAMLLQEKFNHLENSLSSETRLKLDLFSALGECKRQLQLKDGTIMQQNLEIEDLKLKIAQVLALTPLHTSPNDIQYEIYDPHPHSPALAGTRRQY